jgi:hypothetical protein
VAQDGAEVARIVNDLTPSTAARIGTAARARALAVHTYARRARDVSALFDGMLGGGETRSAAQEQSP